MVKITIKGNRFTPGVGEYKTCKGNQPAASGLFLAPGTHYFDGSQSIERTSRK